MRICHHVHMDETTRLWGANLTRFRRFYGWTQEHVAKELEVDQSTIARWEAGLTEPRRHMKVRLADLYQTDVAILFPLTRAVA